MRPSIFGSCIALSVALSWALFGALACRDTSGWQIEALERADATASDEGYRQAVTTLSPALRAVVEARMRGVPLDAEQEQRALHEGWRAPAK